ncbi:phosphotransferase family protein [Pseudomonadales bacterium]|nr:phosphotransferase family protein [Pseudomonadales bacterium]MDB9868268.1 phosphotransferase family protein [Pseudomonadales bacterium]MDB9943120.1 phosphotransferase family protein [Pseudomonadales bacterium]MDC0175191.1 phosphotransferase family protein [Pseudomonadales bacterium]
MLSLEAIQQRLAAYLSQQWQTPVEVESISQIFGGASRDTYRLRVTSSLGERGLIVRCDPPSSLIDTERALEYGAYLAIYPTAIPVPEALYLENDPVWLEQPFSIMAEIESGISAVADLTAAQRASIGQQKWHILGRLAALDPVELGFDKLTAVPLPMNCASEQLAYWARVIADDAMHPQPIAAAAIRWLRRNLPPAPQKLAVVHGDYRSGNFLFEPDGAITAILDWEMCHLGDPLEDLAWSLDPLWCWESPALAGRLLPPSEAIAIWEKSSGLRVDPQHFTWWRVFASLKGLAIWISSTENFQNGESQAAILAMAGWMMTDRQNRILLDYLSVHSKHEFGGDL